MTTSLDELLVYARVAEGLVVLDESVHVVALLDLLPVQPVDLRLQVRVADSGRLRGQLHAARPRLHLHRRGRLPQGRRGRRPSLGAALPLLLVVLAVVLRVLGPDSIGIKKSASQITGKRILSSRTFPHY